MQDSDKLLHTGGKHYKFWSYDIDDDHTVTCKWGRLGTKGQNKSYTHSSRWGAEEYVSGKLHEKFRKGYKQVSEEAYDLEQLRGEIVGAGAKVKECGFVKFDKDANHWFFTETSDMYDPNYIPRVFCEIALTGNKGVHCLMIDLDDVYEAEVLSRSRGICPDTGRRRVLAFRLSGQTKITNTPDKKLQRIVEKAPGIISSLIR